MIELYSGTPGSGKSLNAVIKADEYYKKGLPVIANFDITFFGKHGRGKGFYLRLYNDDFTVTRMQTISNIYKERLGRRVKEEEILLIIDEAQLLFNTRSWNDRLRTQWISFFSQHRKLGYKIILIAQSDLMIDKQIRSLIEYEHIHRKVSNLGRGGKIINFLLSGESFVDVTLYKPMKMHVGSKYFNGRRCYYDMYSTFGTF